MTSTEIGGNSPIDIADLLARAKRRKKPALITAGVVLAAGLLAALFMPPVYLSSSTVLIEQQEIPQDLVRSTVTSYAGQRIEIIKQRTMTYANLSEVIKKYDLYADERKSEPMEQIIEVMRDDVTTRLISAEVVDPRSGQTTKANIAFSIAYRSASPDLAQKVANEITSLFLNENLKNRREMTELTEKFLGVSADQERLKVAEIEKKIADFKKNHAKELPEYAQLNFASLERAEVEYREQQIRMDSLEERRIFLAGEMARLGASRVFSGGDLNGLNPEDKLQYLYNSAVQLRVLYGDNHPDVIRTNRSIDELVAQGVRLRDKSFVRELIRRKEDERASLVARYSASHPDVIKIDKTLTQLRSEKGLTSAEPRTESNNPDYIQLSVQLQAAEQNISALKIQMTEQQAKIAELQKSLSEAPHVEQDYRALMRDLESATRTYIDFDAKQTQARMAQQLEQEQKGEKFTLIEPPITPVNPIKPNRKLLAALSFVAALAAAAALIYVLERLDTSVRGERALTELLGFAPLAVLPHMHTQNEMAMRWSRTQWLAGLGAILAAFLVFYHVLIKPLDVLFYMVLRKLGI